MLVSIGSRRKPKVAAVAAAFARYPELWVDAEKPILVFTVPAQSRGSQEAAAVGQISAQPTTLEETVRGAEKRASAAYQQAIKQHGECDFGVGLEAGIFPAPSVNSGYLDTSIAVVFDGSRYYYGGSPLFEYPKRVTQRLLAGEEAGLITSFFGDSAKGREGVIGPLTRGRLHRDSFEELAVLMALTQVVRCDLYNRGT